MRNLKRAISLALASVMLMGTMVIGTAATTFTDAEDITNSDAVTILSALRVMSGRDTGDFDPTAVVTRAEMATILCRVIYGPDVETRNFVGAGNFTDTVEHWAEGYIGMAYSEGWISGNGDGTFTPNDTVTTAQAALMMQRALGYYSTKDSSVNPASYVLDAVRLGNKLDMFDGISASATQGLTRDEVACMTYNMMFNTMRVAYSVSNEFYYAMDASYASSNNPNIVVEDDKTIAALVFDVTIDEDVDVLGRPVKNVIVDKETLATTTVDYTTIYVDSSDRDDITDKMEQDVIDDTNLVLNGTLTTLDKVFDGDDESLTGIVIEVYDEYNADGESSDDETLYVAYSYSYGEVTKVDYDEDEDETTIRIDSKNYTVDGETSFEKEDMVMFTAAGSQIDTITEAITVEGLVTGVATSFVKLDGDHYDFVTDGLLTTSQLGDTYALYLTPHGYVMGVEEVEDNGGVDANYLYITYAEISMGDVKAKAVFADGTEQIIQISDIYSETAGDYVDCKAINTGAENALTYSDDASSSVYSYKISSGEYKLTRETATVATTGAYITNGYITTVDADGKAVDSFTFDEDTVFVDVENGATYVGYEAVPSFSAFGANNLFIIENVVFMLDGERDDSEVGIYVYLESDSKYSKKIGDDTYYVYTDAYLDGELVKDGLIAEVSTMVVGNVYEVEMDSDGYVTDVVDTIALPEATDTDSETRSIGKSTIYTVGGNRYTYDSDSVFVLVDLIDDEVSVGSASDLMAQSDDEDEMTQLLVIADDDGKIELAYIVLSEKSL